MTIGTRSPDQSCRHGTSGHCHECDGEKCDGCAAGWPRRPGAPWVHLRPDGSARLCEDLEAIDAAANGALV